MHSWCVCVFCFAVFVDDWCSNPMLGDVVIGDVELGCVFVLLFWLTICDRILCSVMLLLVMNSWCAIVLFCRPC